ncbi:MAG: DUF6524 family protein [Pseudomonadota bacterium]
MNRRDNHFMTQFAIRIVSAIAVVLLTYNPTGWSFVHWLRDGFETNLPLKVLAGLGLLIAYVVLIRATLHSIRIAGVVLVGALVAAIVWVMVYYNILNLDSGEVVQWIVLLGIGFILGVGLSWAIIRRRISGQYTVDEAESADGV